MVKRVEAAGILPFAIDPGTMHDASPLDRVLLLLGKESDRRHFDECGLWCDFGGGIKRGAIDTAASREFFEETMGCIYTVRNKAVERIRANDYTAVVDSFVDDSKSYRMFLMRVPLRPYPSIFRQRKKTSHKDLRVHIPQLFRTNGKLKRDATEKSELKWVSVREALFGPLTKDIRPVFRTVLETMLQSNIFAHMATKPTLPYGECQHLLQQLSPEEQERQKQIRPMEPPVAPIPMAHVEVHGVGCDCNIGMTPTPSAMSVASSTDGASESGGAGAISDSRGVGVISDSGAAKVTKVTTKDAAKESNGARRRTRSPWGVPV